MTAITDVGNSIIASENNAQSILTQIKTTLASWQGRFVQEFRTNHHFAVVTCVAYNTVCFLVLCKVAKFVNDRIDGALTSKDAMGATVPPNKYMMMLKSVCTDGFICVSTYGINVFFSKYFNFPMRLRTLVAISCLTTALRNAYVKHG